MLRSLPAQALIVQRDLAPAVREENLEKLGDSFHDVLGRARAAAVRHVAPDEQLLQRRDARGLLLVAALHGGDERGLRARGRARVEADEHVAQLARARQPELERAVHAPGAQQRGVLPVHARQRVGRQERDHPVARQEPVERVEEAGERERAGGVVGAADESGDRGRPRGKSWKGGRRDGSFGGGHACQRLVTSDDSAGGLSTVLAACTHRLSKSSRMRHEFPGSCERLSFEARELAERHAERHEMSASIPQFQ